MTDKLQSDISYVRGEIDEIKDSIKKIADVIGKIAVQEEKIAHLSNQIKQFRADLAISQGQVADIIQTHGAMKNASMTFVGKLGDLKDEHESLRSEIGGVKGKFAELKERHDRCPVDQVRVEIGWIKWFVMANSAAFTAIIIAAVIHYIRG